MRNKVTVQQYGKCFAHQDVTGHHDNVKKADPSFITNVSNLHPAIMSSLYI